MSPKAQRIAIAEVLSWHSFRDIGGDGETRLWGMSAKMKATSLPTELVPDFLTDLNAMHAAEKVLTEERPDPFGKDQRCRFMTHLGEIVGCWKANQQHNSLFQLSHATAAQRAEAFLRCIGAWE